MKEFILLMHNDASDKSIANDGSRWGAYLSGLRASGHFDGGSSIGSGITLRKGRDDLAADTDVDGFIRLRAENIEGARRMVAGNPVYEGGGTVEVRELLADG